MPPAAKHYIALLRAVNVSARNMVGMADLKALLEGLGLRDVRTLLQSGNVIFTSDNRSAARLERTLEESAEARFGFATDFFVRTPGEWRAMVDANPFPKEAVEDPGHLVAVLLKGPATAARVAALQKVIKGREVVRTGDRCVYAVYPDGIGHSKLTNVVIEKALGARSTARNWNTVLKLDALASAR